MEIVLILLFCSLAALFMYGVDRIFSGKRTRELQEQARELGLAYRPKGDPFANTATRGLSFLETNPGAIVVDLIDGMVRGFHFVVFDLGHSTESSPVVLYTTVAAFRCPTGCLPVIDLQHGTALERIEEVLHHGRSEHKICERGFLVEFEDSAQVSLFLTPDKMSRLGAHPEHFRVETSSDWLCVYLPGVRVRPRFLPRFIGLAADIALTLMNLDNKTSPVPATAPA